MCKYKTQINQTWNEEQSCADVSKRWCKKFRHRKMHMNEMMMEGDHMDTQVWSIYELALMWAKNNAWLSSQPSQTLAFVSQIWYNMQQNMQSHINSFTVPSYPREQAKSDSGKEKLPFVQRVVHIVHSSTFSNNDSEDPVQGSLCWEQLKSHTLNILH